jgi:hypothetical protein
MPWRELSSGTVGDEGNEAFPESAEAPDGGKEPFPGSGEPGDASGESPDRETGPPLSRPHPRREREPGIGAALFLLPHPDLKAKLSLDFLQRHGGLVPFNVLGRSQRPDVFEIVQCLLNLHKLLIRQNNELFLAILFQNLRFQYHRFYSLSAISP